MAFGRSKAKDDNHKVRVPISAGDTNIDRQQCGLWSPRLFCSTPLAPAVFAPSPVDCSGLYFCPTREAYRTILLAVFAQNTKAADHGSFRWKLVRYCTGDWNQGGRIGWS